MRGHAATAALLLAEEYETRAAQLEGRPVATTYVGNIERIGELVTTEREALTVLEMREGDLVTQLAATRQQRQVAEARLDAILKTARLLDMPDLPRTSMPPRFDEAARDQQQPN